MGFFDRLRALGSTAPVVNPTQTRGRRDPGVGKVVGTLPLWLQMQRIGGNLTPVQVSEIIRQADTGYMWRLMDLANESRQKDGHLQSVLQTRELALTGLEWRMRPYQAKGAKKAKLRDQKAADFAELCIRDLESTDSNQDPGSNFSGFQRLISHLVGGKYYGYAVAENLWTKEGSKIVPGGFDTISPRRFVHDLAQGQLRWCDINGGMAYPGINLRETYPGKFIQFQPRVNGDVPCREGLVRVLMWSALFRNWDMRDWLTLAELAWKPWRTGMYKKDASDEDIANLEAVLDAMSASGVATYPDTTEVKIEWPTSGFKGNSAHGELFQVLGSEMSKAVLGQTLTTEQGAKGSQALGRVHDAVRRDILVADAKDVAAIITRDLITPLIRMNFGDAVRVPCFEFVTEDDEDLNIFSLAVLNFQKAGLRMSSREIRERAGLSEPEDDEETIGAEEEEEEEEAKPDGTTPAGETPTESETPNEQPEEDAGAAEGDG